VFSSPYIYILSPSMGTPGRPVTYIFPVYKPTEILHCCQDLGIPLQSEQEILNPHPQTLRLVYEMCVEALTGASIDSLKQPNFKALNELSFPELYTETIAEVRFLKKLQMVMNAAGVKGFSFRDLTDPTPKSTRKYLSALINFMLFRDERLEKFQELQKRNEDIVQQRQFLELSLQESTSQLHSLQEKREAEQPQIDALTVEVNALESEIQQLNTRQAEVQAANKETKKQTISIKEKLEHAQFVLISTKQECSRLKSQLVENPEQLKRLVEELKTSVENEKAAVLTADKRALELQSRLEDISRAEKEIQKNSKDVRRVRDRNGES